MNHSHRIAPRKNCAALALLLIPMMTLQPSGVLAAAERLLPCWSFDADSALVHASESLRESDEFPISAYLDTHHRTIVRFDSRGEIERQTPFSGEAALLMRADEPLVVRPGRWTILSQPHYRDGATGCYQVDVLADSAVEIERLAYVTFNERRPGYLDANWTFAKREARVSFGDGPITLPYRSIHSGLLVGDRLHAIGTLVFEVRQAGYRSWSAPLHYLSFTNQGDEVGDIDLRVDGDPTTALWAEDGSVALLVREHPELTRPALVVARPDGSTRRADLPEPELWYTLEDRDGERILLARRQEDHVRRTPHQPEAPTEFLIVNEDDLTITHRFSWRAGEDREGSRFSSADLLSSDAILVVEWPEHAMSIVRFDGRRIAALEMPSWLNRTPASNGSSPAQFARLPERRFALAWGDRGAAIYEVPVP